tara:strand:+ start:204 stop:818 length:615 start_codon:yes stop_codon:yes gene_type:complete
MYKLFFKRVLDIFFSLIIMLILSPLFAVVSIIIFLRDGLPVLFLQERIGKDGIPFTLVKFRSMSNESDKNLSSFSPGERRRVTEIGSILRKYKIDEFPQFFNVLKGDISVVGPRPEVRIWVEKFPEEFAKIHTIKPGITDYASIKFRDEESILAETDDAKKEYEDNILPTKMAINIEYIDKRSFCFDFIIIIKTFLSIVCNKKK